MSFRFSELFNTSSNFFFILMPLKQRKSGLGSPLKQRKSKGRNFFKIVFGPVKSTGSAVRKAISALSFKRREKRDVPQVFNAPHSISGLRASIPKGMNIHKIGLHGKRTLVVETKKFRGAYSLFTPHAIYSHEGKLTHLVINVNKDMMGVEGKGSLSRVFVIARVDANGKPSTIVSKKFSDELGNPAVNKIVAWAKDNPLP